MVGSDGKYFYGRGCCYGVEYELQIWGTGHHGTTLGESYGTVNAPPVGLDNGKESALLYLPKRNKLVYWKWNHPEVFVAKALPRHIRTDGQRTLQWVSFNSYAYNLPLADGAASISNDESDILIFDYANLRILRVDGDTLKVTETTTLASSAHILAPSPNEDLHTFAFDGEHYLFGSYHSGHCYAIFSRTGESLGSQCDKLGGSMLYYNWALHMFEACGTDSAAPPAFEVFNGGVGNGAHCTFWSTPRVPTPATLTDSATGNNAANSDRSGARAPHASGGEDDGGLFGDFFGGEDPLNQDEVTCPEDYPLFAGRYEDETGNVWTIEQEQCMFVISFDYVMGRSHVEDLGGGRWGARNVYLEVGSKQDPAYPGFTTPFMVVDRRTLKMGDSIVLTKTKHFAQ
jgi:hypothetical protein